MSEATRITEKGQATIPKPLREKYDLEPVDRDASTERWASRSRGR